MRDVGAHKGMLISTEGYTEAAVQRAYSDELILDVLNFKELALAGFRMGVSGSGSFHSFTEDYAAGRHRW